MAGNPDWQPRHHDPLFILAMDHRESFGKTLFGVRDDAPDPAQAAAMKAAKRLIFEGLQTALPSVTSGRAGVLVDERYGQDVIAAVRDGGLTGRAGGAGRGQRARLVHAGVGRSVA